jgi:hypothetical protein
MASYLMRGIEPAHYLSIREQAQKGHYGAPVTFWRETVEPSDNTARLQVHREDMGYDIVYCVDAAELAAYEQGRAGQ